jgi:hypothetical protein
MPAPLLAAAAAAAAARMIAKKVAQRAVGGITGAGAKNVAKVYRETGNSVKVITPGTKPLTQPNVPYSVKAPRSQDQLKRMGL